MKVAFTLFLASLFLFACNRKGCADPLADNYDSKVVKARNKDCTYGTTKSSPCGNFVEFCADKDSLKLSGPATIQEFANSVVIQWENATGDFKQLELEIFTPKEGNFTASNAKVAKTFTATYVDLTGSTIQSTGSMKITKYNSTDGLSATFNVVFDNGSTLTNGFLYRVQ